MPILETTIEVTVTTWVCNWCGRHSTAPVRVPAEQIAQHFIDTLAWRLLPHNEIACNRCRLHPDVAAAIIAANHGSLL